LPAIILRAAAALLLLIYLYRNWVCCIYRARQQKARFPDARAARFPGCKLPDAPAWLLQL